MEIGEGRLYSAIKPGTERRIGVRISKTSGQDLLFQHNKNKVDVTIASQNDRERSLPMVVKHLSKQQTARGYSQYWASLVSAEITTLPTVRIIGYKDVLITDLTADGSVFYGKDNVYPCFDRFEKGGLTEIDKIFLNINPEEIRARAELMAERATKNGIFLPYDDPFDLLVHPDGGWDVVVLDLVKHKYRANIQKYNLYCVDHLMEWVDQMRLGLTGTGDRPEIVM